MKIRPLGDTLFSGDGKTDRHTEGHDETNSRFAKAPKHLATSG